MSADRQPRNAKGILEDIVRPYLDGSQIPTNRADAVAMAASALAIREGLDELAKEMNRPLTAAEALGTQKDDMT